MTATSGRTLSLPPSLARSHAVYGAICFSLSFCFSLATETFPIDRLTPGLRFEGSVLRRPNRAKQQKTKLQRQEQRRLSCLEAFAGGACSGREEGRGGAVAEGSTKATRSIRAGCSVYPRVSGKRGVIRSRVKWSAEWFWKQQAKHPWAS